MIKKMFRETYLTMIISYLAATIGIVIDGVVIGNFLGIEYTAAYGLAGPVLVFILAITGIFSNGCQNLCAVEMGRGDLKKANRLFSLTVILALICCAILILLINIFVNPLCSLLGAENGTSIYSYLKDYLIGFSFSIPAIAIGFLLIYIRQLEGDKMTVVAATVIMTVVDAIGDISNVFIFKGGMFGMAIATTVSYYSALIFAVIAIIKKGSSYHVDLKNIDWKLAPSIIATGGTNAIEQVFQSLRVMAYNNILVIIAGSATLGSMAIASYSVRSSIDNIFSSVDQGIAVAMLMLTGLLFGEEDRHSLKELIKTSVKTMIILTMFVWLVVFILAPFLVDMFLNDPAAKVLAIRCVRIYSFSIPLYGITCMIKRYLQGIHRLGMSNLISACEMIPFSIGSAYVLGKLFGIEGVFVSFSVAEILSILLMFIAATVKKKRIPNKIEDYMMLNNDFGATDSDVFEATLYDMDGVIKASQDISDFCINHGNKKGAMKYALCVEEMAGNIIKHGFDGKKHCIEIRMMKKNDGFILRIRDDCKAFNPKEWYQLVKSEDKASHIGIKMVFEMAESIEYVNTMDKNTLIVKQTI